MHIAKQSYSAIISIMLLAIATSAWAGQMASHELVGGTVRPPIGWVQFCADNPSDCASSVTSSRDVVITQKTWKDLVEVNRWANEKIKPITDIEHWGTIEKWSYPTDGYGDCEEYALLKRKTLIDAGWPREALLITVVRDRDGEGHAVLTVATDHGDFILDNERADIVMWSETGYRFVKRQAQSDQNVWVALDDLNETHASATATTR